MPTGVVNKPSRALIIMGRVILCLIVAVGLMLALGLGHFIGSILFPSEPLTAKQIAAMWNCGRDPQKEITVRLQGKPYSFRLPPNAAQLSKDEYLAYIENWSKIDSAFVQSGWTWEDQYGSMYVFRNRKSKQLLHVDISIYTRFYCRVKFYEVIDVDK